MKKANLRLMGFLCPRIKHRIPHTVGFYQWFLIPITILFVSCQALAQEVKVQQMPSAATVSINDFKENVSLLKKDGDSPQKEQATTFQEKITPLKIGDKIPDELWEMYFPVVSEYYDEVQYLSLGDFKNNAILLEFSETDQIITMLSPNDLCGIKKVLQNVFVGYVINQSEELVKTVFNDLAPCIPLIMDQDILRAYFSDKHGSFRVLIDQNEFKEIVDGEGSRRS